MALSWFEFTCLELNLRLVIGRGEKAPTPTLSALLRHWPVVQREAISSLLRTPSRFTIRPLPVYYATKFAFVSPFWVLSKDEICPS